MKREVILCPFHQEKTPSCHIDRARGLYVCFGCGKTGPISELPKADEPRP